jgi:hypothetical protein
LARATAGAGEPDPAAARSIAASLRFGDTIAGVSEKARPKIRLDPDNVSKILEEGGWPCDRIADNTWRSHFRGRHASFPFYVRVDPAGFVCFAIVPFVRSPEKQTEAEPLYKKLLELNQTILMAKFSIDDDLDVVLSVEYPSSHLDRSEFDDALDVLSYYADRHYRELRALTSSAAPTP